VRCGTRAWDAGDDRDPHKRCPPLRRALYLIIPIDLIYKNEGPGGMRGRGGAGMRGPGRAGCGGGGGRKVGSCAVCGLGGRAGLSSLT